MDVIHPKYSFLEDIRRRTLLVPVDQDTMRVSTLWRYAYGVSTGNVLDPQVFSPDCYDGELEWLNYSGSTLGMTGDLTRAWPLHVPPLVSPEEQEVFTFSDHLQVQEEQQEVHHLQQ